MKIRALIVDDEPLARLRLRQLLNEESAVELVGECGNGREAVAQIQKESPDLVLLDVQMPELDGFGVVEEIGPDRMPVVVFVTAYDQFALKAFEVHAVDYLLKPFDRERFQTALRRALDRIQQHTTGELSHRLQELLSDLKPDTGHPERIAVKSTGRVVLVRISDLDWVESSDNYVNLHAGGETVLHRETMTAMEAMLPARQFMRISRSTIVNLDRIRELQPLFHGEYAVILTDGTRLTLSRGYRDKLPQLLGKTA